jgi:hypothetical protein
MHGTFLLIPRGRKPWSQRRYARQWNQTYVRAQGGKALPDTFAASHNPKQCFAGNHQVGGFVRAILL